jgi:deoxyribodipyrimidine photolyase
MSTASTMSSRTSIALFTRDLRVHDNPTLQGAVDATEQVLPVFVLDDAILGSAYLAPTGHHSSSTRCATSTSR